MIRGSIPSVTTNCRPAGHLLLLPGIGALQEYQDRLLGYIQTLNREMVAESLDSLREQIYLSSAPIEEIRLFLIDLYLQVKESIRYHYHTFDIPFPPNSWAVDFINTRYYLYEIITFLSEQAEMIMRSLGTTSGKAPWKT